MSEKTKAPPSHLSPEMKALWRKINQEFSLSSEGTHILQLGAEAFDLSQACRKKIAHDGLMMGGKRHTLIGVQVKAIETFEKSLRALQLEAPKDATSATSK